VRIDDLSWQELNEATLKAKTLYFNEIKWCIPFREIHHTIVTVCDFVKPIYPTVNPNKYIDFFLNKIDFENIDREKETEIKENNLKSIYDGLQTVFHSDLTNAITTFQKSIPTLQKERIRDTQIQLIQVYGELKRHTLKINPHVNFTKEYGKFIRLLKAGGKLEIIDYQLLITAFNGQIVHELLHHFEIILEIIRELTPLLNEQPTPKSKNNRTQNLSELITHDQSESITRELKIKYKNIKGKRLKLLLMALQELGMIPQDRIALKFHNACKLEFGDVGKYQAMQDYKFNKLVDSTELKDMKDFIQTLINQN
jgi:hypothetical protein